MNVSSLQHHLTAPRRQTADGAVKAGSRYGARQTRAVLAAFMLGALLSFGCNHAAPSTQGGKAPEVVATVPITTDVTDYQDFTGRLEAVKTVDIRARVAGYATDIPFKEGDLVHEGDLLFQIDPRPYKAQLDAATAQVSTSEANLQLADITYKRARDASDRGKGVVSPLELDQDRAQQELARASLRLAQANQATAQLNWGWTRVLAPVTGRISRRNVDPGNLVLADNTVLTTIVTEDPLYAYFDVDERTFLDLQETFQGIPKETTWSSSLQLPVLMRLANQDKFTQAGKVNFLDNRVNANTGTIRMRGEFSNVKGNLKPGLFARIRLPIGRPYRSLLIPDEALMSDQGRHYVYVVNDKEEVVYRPVQLGQSLEGLRVIKAAKKDKEGQEGLQEGERVIIQGMQRVRPETRVQVKMQEPPQRPASPLQDLLSALPGAKAAVVPTAIKPAQGQ